jgi:D-alanyl-D-alanine carboxypeptidase/D-alanyl-D-alanine-endopeptidase (penicillin-binding protein 4)
MDAPRAQPQADEAARPPTEDPAATEAPADLAMPEDSVSGTTATADADPSLSGAPPPMIGPLREAWLAARFDAIVRSRPKLGAARIGVAIVDPVKERILYQSDGEGHYNLASATKIITTSASLALLGPDFRWRTGIYAPGVDPTGTVTGDLHVRGRGDPTLGTGQLRELVDELVDSGITAVRGALVLDTTYFDDDDEPPHFSEQPKARAAFRAPIGALSLNFNTVAAVVAPARDGLGAAKVTLDPPGDYIRLTTAAVQTISSGRTRVSVDVRKRRDHLELVVTGQIRADAGVTRYRVRIDDSSAYFAAAFKAMLAERGVKFGKRTVAFAALPKTAKPLLVHESEPLAVVVRGLGKFSNNFVAETLLKTIGAEVKLQALIAAASPPGAQVPPPTVESPTVAASWKDGLDAVRAFLVERAGLADGSFRYENGSGLFAASDVSPLALTAVLTAAHRDFRWGSDLLASLSIAGRDGTLRRRMAGTSAERRVRAKTGTLNAVTALAGYAGIDGRSPLAFAILVNDIPDGASADARAVVDAMAASITDYLDDSEQP